MMTHPSTIQAVVFDAYGTLFDVYAVTAKLETFCPDQGAAIAQVWRDKQIEYSRLISLSDPSAAGSRYYEPFLSITQKALAYAVARFGQSLTPDQSDALMAQYAKLDAFAECHGVLEQLKRQGLKTAILSNGDPEMLDGAVTHAGLADLMDVVISVHAVRHFKTMPQAYDLVGQQLAVSPEHVLFVSGNGWDVLAAQWYGFKTCWINRAGWPVETLADAPHAQGQTLDAVLAAVGPDVT